MKKRWRSMLFLLVIAILIAWGAWSLAGCKFVNITQKGSGNLVTSEGHQGQLQDAFDPNASLEVSGDRHRIDDVPVEEFDREEP